MAKLTNEMGNPAVIAYYEGPNRTPVVRIYNYVISEEMGDEVHIRGKRKNIEGRPTDKQSAEMNTILHLSRTVSDIQQELEALETANRKLAQELEELKKGIVTVDEINLEASMLKGLREVHGWSRSDIAAELGVSSEYVRLMERGDRTPSHPIRYKIRKLLR